MRARASHGPACVRSAVQVYADSYRLSGCTNDEETCGLFRRVNAHCTDPDGHGHCPGGEFARPGWTDATLCAGAPVYQREGGVAEVPDGATDAYVLYQWATRWVVGPSEALQDCNGYYGYFYPSRTPVSNSQPLSPDAAIYGWSDPSGYSCSLASDCDEVYEPGPIHIVAGEDGGGGGGH